MSDSTEEFATPKWDGRGDDITNTTLIKKSSVRKLCLVTKRTKPKIHDCLKLKSNTVSELTPTKSKAKRVISHADEDDEETLHATPRPGVKQRAALRRSKQPAPFVFYQKTMLRAWRTTRSSLKQEIELSETLKEQVNQLGLQVDTLKNLSYNENQRRNESVNECKMLKTKLKQEQYENIQLKKELNHTKHDIEQFKTNYELLKSDLKKCNEESDKFQDQLKKLKEEKMNMESQLSFLNEEISIQRDTINELEDDLKVSDLNAKNLTATIEDKKDELNIVLQQLKSQSELINGLQEEIYELIRHNTELNESYRKLEMQLDECVCYRRRQENDNLLGSLDVTVIKVDETKLDERFKYFKRMALKPIFALHKTAQVVLPIFLDRSMLK